jgi:hypothetical protein
LICSSKSKELADLSLNRKYTALVYIALTGWHMSRNVMRHTAHREFSQAKIGVDEMKKIAQYMTVFALVSMALMVNGCGKAPATFTLHTSPSAN